MKLVKLIAAIASLVVITGAIVGVALYVDRATGKVNETADKLKGLAGRLTEVEEKLPKGASEPKSDAKFQPGDRMPGDAIHFSNTGAWGGWSSAKFCPPNHYVCGLQQKVEPSIDGDDTAMNGLAFYCCPLDP